MVEHGVHDGCPWVKVNFPEGQAVQAPTKKKQVGEPVTFGRGLIELQIEARTVLRQ